MNGIMRSVIFGDGLLPLSLSFSRVVCVVGGKSASCLLVA